jgi:hypothetical protein
LDIFFLVIGSLFILLGSAALLETSTGRPGNFLTRRMLRIQGRPQTRAYDVLATLTIIAFGAYLLVSAVQPPLPLWPLILALLAFGALQMAAHMQRYNA